MRTLAGTKWGANEKILQTVYHGATWGASEKILETIYQVAIRPHLEYGALTGFKTRHCALSLAE